MNGEITIDMLVSVLEREVKISQATSIRAYRVFCLPLFLVESFDFCDEWQKGAAVAASSQGTPNIPKGGVAAEEFSAVFGNVLAEYCEVLSGLFNNFSIRFVGRQG